MLRLFPYFSMDFIASTASLGFHVDILFCRLSYLHSSGGHLTLPYLLCLLTLFSLPYSSLASHLNAHIIQPFFFHHQAFSQSVPQVYDDEFNSLSLLPSFPQQCLALAFCKMFNFAGNIGKQTPLSWNFSSTHHSLPHPFFSEYLKLPYDLHHAFMTSVVFSHSKFIISVSPLLGFKLPKCRNYIAINEPFKVLSSYHLKNYFSSDNKIESIMQMFLFFHEDMNEQVLVTT